MNPTRPRNRAASIRQRLLDRARANNDDFQLMLDRYAVERLLYRLSISEERNNFLLKGALLFSLWFEAPHRPTRDADFLGSGAPDAPHLLETIRQICMLECEDGIRYELPSIRVQEIREHAKYQGLRVTLQAKLDRAKCNVQLDVGYGDAVTPAPHEASYPSLLDDLPSPTLRVYPRETVFAEKLEAIAQLGIANSRMKDYFDLLALAREGAMNLRDLSSAITATFEQRATPFPSPLPIGLTSAFTRDTHKQQQWNAFLSRNRLDAPALDAAVEEIVRFLEPLLVNASGSR